jgi:hypothetical protein
MKRHARTNDPTTSHQAAASVDEKTLTRIENHVYLIFKTGKHLTDEDLVKIYTYTGHPGTPQAVRTARNELSRQDKLKIVGIAKTKTGRNARVWSIN